MIVSVPATTPTTSCREPLNVASVPPIPKSASLSIMLSASSWCKIKANDKG